MARLASCDTNILVYYLNADSAEHPRARAYMDAQIARQDFAICELVLIELYVLLRSPSVFPRPLDRSSALAVIRRLRSNPAWKVIDYPGSLMAEVWSRAERPGFARRAIFDARLALTLRHHGVVRFAQLLNKLR